MKETDKLFLLYFIIFFVELVILITIIKEGFNKNMTLSFKYTNVQKLALYILVLQGLEFILMARFCIALQLAAAIQLIPLNVFRYFCLIRIFPMTHIIPYILLYFSLDMTVFIYFLKIKDSAFATVFREYNRAIGVDVKVRNAFIVSQIII